MNVYGRRIPEQIEIARNLAQLVKEDEGRARRIALRRRGTDRRYYHRMGPVSHRWWVSPVCALTVMVFGYLTKDWSWHALDAFLTGLGF